MALKNVHPPKAAEVAAASAPDAAEFNALRMSRTAAASVKRLRTELEATLRRGLTADISSQPLRAALARLRDTAWPLDASLGPTDADLKDDASKAAHKARGAQLFAFGAAW